MKTQFIVHKNWPKVSFELLIIYLDSVSGLITPELHCLVLRLWGTRSPKRATQVINLMQAINDNMRHKIWFYYWTKSWYKLGHHHCCSSLAALTPTPPTHLAGGLEEGGRAVLCDQRVAISKPKLPTCPKGKVNPTIHKVTQLENEATRGGRQWRMPLPSWMLTTLNPAPEESSCQADSHLIWQSEWINKEINKGRHPTNQIYCVVIPVTFKTKWNAILYWVIYYNLKLRIRHWNTVGFAEAVLVQQLHSFWHVSQLPTIMPNLLFLAKTHSPMLIPKTIWD